NKPAVSPENYVADGLTVGKDNTPVQPLKMPEGEESDLPAPSQAGANENAATDTVSIDFQCPGRQPFEDGSSAMLQALADEGTSVLDCQPVSFLDRTSSGHEYSARSADLAACVVDSHPEVAVDLFDALFAQQPEEGGDGRTDA